MNKIYKAISPDKEEYTFTKMFKFCKDHNLNASCMFNVANNRRPHHKGWKVSIINNIIRDEESKGIEAVLQSTSWFSTNIKRIYTRIRNWATTK